MTYLILLVLALVAAALWYASGRLHAQQMEEAAAAEPEPGPAYYPLLAVYFTLLIKIGQADGHLGQNELDFARRHLRRVARLTSGGVFSAADLARLEDTILRRGHEVSLDDTAALVREAWHDLARPEPAETFFEEAVTALASIASLDGTLDAQEEGAVARIARTFGISDARYEALRAVVVQELGPRVSHFPQGDDPAQDSEPPDPQTAPETTLRRHYGTLLGLQGRLTRADVRRRYRELLAQYHPDKVAHLGPELRALAERKTKEINEAYAWLARHHRL